MIEIRALTLKDYATCIPAAPWVDVETTVNHGYAMYDGDRLVGIAGILPYWPGVGEAWLSLAPTYQPSDLRAGIRALRAVLSNPNLPYDRIQADVAPHLARWIEVLGFQYESTMPRYTPDGGTLLRYVRFPHGY